MPALNMLSWNSAPPCYWYAQGAEICEEGRKCFPYENNSAPFKILSTPGENNPGHASVNIPIFIYKFPYGKQAEVQPGVSNMWKICICGIKVPSNSQGDYKSH